MPRIKLELPSRFGFNTRIPIRITDINYGGHTGNDSILSIIHEARVQFLKHHGYEEKNLAGVGLIMSDVVIEYKKELYYGDTISISVAASDFERVRFDIFYRLDIEKDGKTVTVVSAKTGMVCFDYTTKKMASIPEEVKMRLQSDNTIM